MRSILVRTDALLEFDLLWHSLLKGALALRFSSGVIVHFFVEGFL